MKGNPVVCVASALMIISVAACGQMRTNEAPGASPDSSHQRHNDWARFGRPDVGGARANDR
jgi:hypothetical protein